jgi:hypothetical protein
MLANPAVPTRMVASMGEIETPTERATPVTPAAAERSSGRTNPSRMCRKPLGALRGSAMGATLRQRRGIAIEVLAFLTLALGAGARRLVSAGLFFPTETSVAAVRFPCPSTDVHLEVTEFLFDNVSRLITLGGLDDSHVTLPGASVTPEGPRV